MKRLIGIFCILSFSISACNTSGVENPPDGQDTVEDGTKNSVQSNLDDDRPVEDEKQLDNGIIIRWFEHGEGAKIGNGDCIEIDYKVLLKDRSVVDGNHLLNKKSLPFIVGFKMQTEGWDIALNELKVGDFAEIIIPSELARGEKGIEGLIPPNADNILKIKILEKKKPSREIDGNKVWIFEENEKNKLKFEEGMEIQFHCMVSSPTNQFYVNTYRTGTPFSLKLDDSGTTPGLKKALINAKKSDRMFVLVPSSEAYGDKGYLDIVKPDEDLFYNVLVIDVLKK